MLARENADLKRALAQADMVATDGMPLVWIERRAGSPDAERVYGPDIMVELCLNDDRFFAAGHYFYGGLPGVADDLAAALAKRNPSLRVAGYEAPPHVSADDIAVDAQTVARLNASGADIIWIGLGSPKQDLWMAAYRPLLKAPLLIGVGAAFDFLSGHKAQAPRWMQRSGLEWAFRLAREPRRLWKRYVWYNARFLWLVATHGIPRGAASPHDRHAL
jgi:N-acetylglucosaminyldiphosphoundecaprenol N-acetyl-beta-D-mannosaminyltransferase